MEVTAETSYDVYTGKLFHRITVEVLENFPPRKFFLHSEDGRGSSGLVEELEKLIKELKTLETLNK